jgi:cytochrome c nitrite reductase small subunit
MPRSTSGLARRLAPPQAALIAAAALCGVAGGLGAYTFVYARGYSYLTNDPRACANCHVMLEQYDAWTKASHRSVATCDDCHTPPGLLGKYAARARNGFLHSFHFTTGTFHEPIRIGERGRGVTEGACRSCHADVVQAMGTGWREIGPACLRCHGSVGHMALGAGAASGRGV